MEKEKLKQILLTTAIALVFGVLAGAGGAALTTNYLAEYSLKLGQLTAPLGLSEERPRGFPKAYAEAVAKVTDRSLPASVEFFQKKSGPVPDYRSEEALMRGAVLTADGWIAGVPPAGANPANWQAAIGRQVYPVRSVVRDPATGVAFIKIEGSGLPVMAFGNSYDRQTGDQVFLAAGSNSILAREIFGRGPGKGIYRQSETLSGRLLLDDKAGSAPPGAPLMNLEGELIGLSDGAAGERATIVPIEYWLPAFTSLLRLGKIERPALGLRYVDLAESVGLTAPAPTKESGAWLYGSGAVAWGSAAAAAGLKNGDIITAVDGQTLDRERGLEEYLLDYRVGDTVTITAERNGESRQFTAILTQER